MYNNLQHVTSLGVRTRSLRPSLRRHPRRHPRGRVRSPTPISRVRPHRVVTHAQRRREQEVEPALGDLLRVHGGARLFTPASFLILRPRRRPLSRAGFGYVRPVEAPHPVRL